MSIKQKAVKGVLWSAIQNWGSQAGALIIFFVLARLLEPEAFGLVALANVFLAFMQIFLNQGFAQALIQREDLEPEHLDTAFWINFGIGIILTALTLGTANQVAIGFNEPQLAPLLRGLSIVFLINSLSGVQQATLERKFAFKAIAFRWLLGTIVGGVVGVGMALYGLGVWSLVGQQVVQELVGVSTLWFASDWRPGFRFSIPHLRQLWGFGVNILAFNFLSFFNTRADDFLIGYFLGTVALGYYSIAYRILGVLTQLLVNTSNQVALPSFARLQTDLDRFRNAFYTVTQLTSLIAFPTFLGVAVLAPELILLMFGDQWEPSIVVMQILAFMGIVRAVTHFKSSVFLAMGKPAWRLWLGLLNAVISPISFLIAVQWGIVAVAFAYVIRGYLVFPVGQWAVSRLIHVPLISYLRQFVAPLVSSLVMAVVILITKQWIGDRVLPIVTLGTGIVVGTLVYGITIRLLSPKLFQQLLEFVQLALSRSQRQNA
ncbi:lipopolysaccharide biosynthesis protein [Egbenema bharatensis]|uniref:lipopolysaccharide biosynthesis protein n=1 Tax=Egbenema bharatensis TaxID=3463334 RepID=UPI003A8B20DC